MFYDYVTRQGSDLRVLLGATRIGNSTDESKVWLESDKLITRLAILFLSHEERLAITARSREEAVQARNANCDDKLIQSYTDQGIAAATERALGGEEIKEGAKVGRIGGDDVAGILLSSDGDYGQVQFSPDPRAKPHRVKMNELFDADMANRLAHAFRAADQ